jgi:excinuclease ABC subunit C
MPDILFVDGGKGQLRQAREVFDELAIQGVMLVGVAKGEGRKSGLETLFTDSHPDGLTLQQNSTGFLLVQHIRDESHRFAITGHRSRRGKARTKSTLEEIPGLGPKRRQSLLQEFGGIKGIARASVEELQKISGISRKLALKVYDVYHHD